MAKCSRNELNKERKEKDSLFQNTPFRMSEDFEGKSRCEVISDSEELEEWEMSEEEKDKKQEVIISRQKTINLANSMIFSEQGEQEIENEKRTIKQQQQQWCFKEHQETKDPEEDGGPGVY